MNKTRRATLDATSDRLEALAQHPAAVEAACLSYESAARAKEIVNAT